ncbi:MAG: TfoX/Sxy family protein [Bacteroidetes bacterium]|nr:MAG: TfoX/Sxy family protein [Bacteroidota bacterium]
MAYDESLAKRIDELVKGKKGVTRKQMFGGIAYLLNGNMCVGVHKDELIIRYDPKKTEEITTDKHVRPFDITGRPMKGWSLVNKEGTKGSGLDKWFEFSLSYVKSLPAKK